MDCDVVKLIREEYLIWDTRSRSVRPIPLESHQCRILNHAFTPREDGTLKYRTIVYSCPKKSGKTEIAAAVVYAFCRLFGGNCYSIANDEDQAATRMWLRVKDMIDRMEWSDVKKIIHPDLLEKGRIFSGRKIDFASNDQLNPGPHWLSYIANDYKGEAGGMPALTVWDELWAYSQEAAFRLWEEMQPTPTLPVSIRFVTTYAGWYGESNLLWNLYEQVVQPDPYDPFNKLGDRVPGLEDLPVFEKGATLVYWDHEARMPWHTPEFMEESKNDPACFGRESEWRRIWGNEWTTGLDPFLDVELWDELAQMGTEAGLINHMPQNVTLESLNADKARGRRAVLTPGVNLKTF